MGLAKRQVALITGGSRGVGAAAALSLAGLGYDVAITYHNKAARADEVVTRVMQQGMQALAIGCDITRQEDIDQLFIMLGEWTDSLDVLVLNASGGLERDLVEIDPQYPMRINRDAQLAILDGALKVMVRGGVVVFVTSHWAHLYGQVEQLPSYAPVAESKYAGEQALLSRKEMLAENNVRLIIVTGDLIEGTITPRLLERNAPGLVEQRRNIAGYLPTTDDMGRAIAAAAVDTSLLNGHIVVVGGSLESLPHRRG